MANMSYCKFENTYHDLCDCYDNIDTDDVSDREEKYRKLLIKVCIDIANMFVDEDGEEL